MIIDCHGHDTTAPEPHDVRRETRKAEVFEGVAHRVYPPLDAVLEARER